MNSLVSNLKEMLKLEERREQLVSELDVLTSKLNKLKNSLDLSTSGPAASDSAAAAPREKKTGRPPKSSTRSGRAPRGETKQRILAELKGAGAEGVSVQDLAEKLNMGSIAIHAWFNTTGKKVSEIKKVGRARYGLSGSSSKAEPVKAAPAESKPVREKKAPKTPKAAKATRSAKGARKGNSRGQLKGTIMSALEKAGSKGMTVREISEKTGVPYKNVYIWFVTTGKKNSSIQRTAPATYRLLS